MRAFSLLVGVAGVLCSLLSASSLLRVTALDPTGIVADVYLQHIVYSNFEESPQWKAMFQQLPEGHLEEDMPDSFYAPLQVCTDQDNNIYFIGGLFGRYIGRVEALSSQFAAPAEPTAPITFGLYHSDAYTSPASYPTPQDGAFERSPQKFSPHALACGSDGTLWFIDHQARLPADNRQDAPAMAKLTPDGTMEVLQYTAGRLIPTYNSVVRMYADALFYDEARSQMFYALNCDFCHFPHAGQDPDDPVNGITIREDYHIGAVLGRYLQPGVPSAISPPLPDTVDEQVFSPYKNPPQPASAPYNPMPNFNDEIGRYMTSGGVVEEEERFGFDDISFWSDAYHNYPAYDKQKQLLYFGGRPEGVYEAITKGKECIREDWVDPNDEAQGMECKREVDNTSHNTVQQNAIWVQSQEIVPGAENERGEFDAVNLPVQVWVSEEANIRFQALALSPEGDLYFCARDLSIADFKVQLFYFTASQLNSRIDRNEFTESLIIDPIPFPSLQPQRVQYELYDPEDAAPVAPARCEFLHFDRNGVLYMTDAANGIYAFRNLHTKPTEGDFHPLPVTVRAVGSIVPQRGVRQD